MERLVKLSLSSILLISVVLTSCKKDVALDTNQINYTGTIKDTTGKNTVVVPPKDTVVKPPVVVPPVVVPPVASGALNAEENNFDHVIYANGSFGWNSTTRTPTSAAANNGEEVGKLKTAKGNWSVAYRGNGWSLTQDTQLPGMDGKLPVLIDDKFLAFKNVPATYYEQTGGAIPQKLAPPFEMWLVSRYMPGQRYEERLAGGGNCSLLGDSEYLIRAVNPQYGFVPNSVMPEIYKTHIERLVVKDQTQADYWIDGVYVGTVKFQAPDLNGYVKTDEVIGVVSNNAVWDFAAQYYKIGNLDNATAAKTFTSLSTKWNTGVLPDQILLSNIGFSKTGSVYTPSAKVINVPAGVAVADPSQWDYKWYQDDGTLGKQVLWSTDYQPSVSSFDPSKGTRIKVTIKPKDTNGKGWRYLEGTYASN
jgi:hypothetical protein